MPIEGVGGGDVYQIIYCINNVLVIDWSRALHVIKNLKNNFAKGDIDCSPQKKIDAGYKTIYPAFFSKYWFKLWAPVTQIVLLESTLAHNFIQNLSKQYIFVYYEA